MQQKVEILEGQVQEGEERGAGEVQEWSQGGVTRKWKYLHILEFLEPYNQDRETTSNYHPQTATVILNNICSEAGQVIK